MSFEFIAGASAWIWDKYGKEISDKALGVLKEKWSSFKWAEAAQRYRERMLDYYSTTHILGNPQPISLEGIFTDVYVLDKPTALRRFDIEKLRTSKTQGIGELEADRKNALRIALEIKRLFVLGKPGAGKTTFLKFLTLKALGGKIDNVPIFVSLKEWTDTHLELLPYMYS